ncbi:hypothetical protein BGW36DRAFT_458775 [Talaromyces proteolyticus]|uniref:Uncharacterized protein n=1 Tax=Talaromyces proteolyticus TaxID=1131652 RepID=A0AAD4PYW2_9EURO|nr:uncharacterized protein BGW36DRAFT_458775 [Talaromyces proteolyticus]KAH8701975.1 hypothetical protein BGW36DRAFT_458775 [Talaromyces proteolyticus]
MEDTLGRASPEIRAFIEKMSGRLVSERLKAKTSAYSSVHCSQKQFSKSVYPGPENDQLYKANIPHKHWKKGHCPICDKCKASGDDVCEEVLKASCTELGCNEETRLIQRDRLQQVVGMPLTAQIQEARNPYIHFGRMASSNQVMKSGQDRNVIAAEEGVIGFDMESAGTWDYVPTIVIKTVCDYADSHKDKQWQPYAAITAAACTKAVLEEWRSRDKPVRRPINQKHLGSKSNPVHWAIPSSTNTIFTGRDRILRELENVVCDAVRILGTIITRLSFPALAARARVKSASNWRSVFVNHEADNLEIGYQQYFPASISGVVILTSRNGDHQQYTTSKCIHLPGLEDAEACELLLKAADVPSGRGQALRNDASIVSNILGSHPLALIQAGMYISRGHCTLKDFPEAFNQQQRRILTFQLSPVQSRYRDVYTTFEASANILQSLGTQSANDALDLLSVLALCDANYLPLAKFFEAAYKGAQVYKERSEDDLTWLTRENGPPLTHWDFTWLKKRGLTPLARDNNTAPRYLLSIVESWHSHWDSFRLIEAIHLLKKFSFVLTDTNEGFLGVSIHPLVLTWARSHVHAEKLVDKVSVRILQHNGNVKAAISELEQVVRIQKQSRGEDSESKLVELLQELAICYSYFALEALEAAPVPYASCKEDHYKNEAIQIMRQVVEIERRILGEKHEALKISQDWYETIMGEPDFS